MIRVLIADDHVIVRNGLKQLIQVMGDIAVTGEASNGEEVLAALRQGKFDLLLLDLTMPGLNGVNLIGRILADHSLVPILVLSMHDELQIARRVLEAGAAGFVTKGSGEDTLMTAIRKVAGGERYVDAAIVEQMMFNKPSRADAAPHERLSERELNVMMLLSKGLCVKEIARRLFISDKTVSTHKVRLMRKMSFKNNADLVRYAVDRGLIQ